MIRQQLPAPVSIQLTIRVYYQGANGPGVMAQQLEET